MKRLARSTVLAMILLLLLIPLGVYANGQPQCPEGMIEIVPAEWVPPMTHEITVVDQEAWDEVVVDEEGYWIHHEAITHQEWVPGIPAVTHQEYRCRKLFGGWHRWKVGRCCTAHCWFGCQERTVIDVPAIPGYWITVVDQEAWDEWVPPVTHIVHHEAITHQETIVDEEGYWIKPVCEAPPAKPVCPLQLLVNYNPPEDWLPYCLVLTEGGASVERQQTLCGWIADNQPCGGMVYDDGTEYGQWACDRYGYYRQPISVLKCLWQRHLNGQRDHESFAKCHGVERPAPPQPVGPAPGSTP